MLTLKDSSSTWYPISIADLEDHLGFLMITNSRFTSAQLGPLRKNIAYTLQYVEFLDRVLKDLKLSSVLWTQNVKSFVVYGASVIEAIFFYLVVSAGQQSNSTWNSVKKYSTAEYDLNGRRYKNEIEVFEKVAQPVYLEMTFDQLSKKIETKKLLGARFPLYSKINPIRKLRNKIHIHGIEDASDTDWWNFNQGEFDLMREVLHGVLTSGKFSPSTHKAKFNYLRSED